MKKKRTAASPRAAAREAAGREAATKVGSDSTPPFGVGATSEAGRSPSTAVSGERVMRTVDRKQARSQGELPSPGRPAPDQRWAELELRFLAAVMPAQRPAVMNVLRAGRHGGRGLRSWLRRLLASDGSLPPLVPEELVAIYLEDPDAMPLHDCAECGLAIPVRPRLHGWDDDDPDIAYFPKCPCCGGRTGACVYWSNTKTRNDHGPRRPEGGR
jgi:hypothetical protein